MTARWGASPQEWAWWGTGLRLTKDLLPVVSDLTAAISPDSKVKRIGKTPSDFNRRGEVRGLVGWTQQESTPVQVAGWSKVDAYGICLQTRHLRAIDIDVPDQARSDEVAAFVQGWCLCEGLDAMPRRWRINSGKQLLLFRLEGDYGKHSFPMEGENVKVEILMTGQQCIVAGTHESGERYLWEGAGGLPPEAPSLTDAQWQDLWRELVQRFALSAPTVLGRVPRGADLDLEDEEARWLIESWETYGSGGGGRKLYVRCPWADGHSSESGESEAVWLMRGVGGHLVGHFDCKHDSCAKHKREDFLAAVGFTAQAVAAGFDVVETESDESSAEGGGRATGLPLPGFSRKAKGVIKADIANVVRGCQYAEACGWHIAYDTFIDDLMLAPPGTQAWRPITEGDPVRMRMALEKLGFDPIGREMIRDALILVGEDKQFDSAQAWLAGLAPWDGIERCAKFFVDYMPGVDDAYGRAMGRYVWSAHAGRVISPGCQVDMSPVLVGLQGLRKTSGVRAIAPAAEFFVEMNFGEKEDDRSRKMRGTLVAELAELRGLNSKEADEIRAFMTRPVENWTPKFKERTVRFKRRLLFWGTSNEDEILADPAGERRWLPRRVTGTVDVAAIERDRDQLWAEGLAIYRAEGVEWRQAELLARGEHDAYRVVDPWEERIAGWLDEADLAGDTPRGGKGFKLETVAVSVLGMDFARLCKRDEMRIAKILRICGMDNPATWVNGKTQRVWTCKK